jgi:phosphopantothenoylcysteine decarboxylase/phosphopantothenate--cysteine ligase
LTAPYRAATRPAEKRHVAARAASRRETVVLGVSGGIAAYKAVEVLRRLVDSGLTVLPVLTPAALHFVGEATFSALGSERARSGIFAEDDPIPHTTLGRRADLVVVAPATARMIGSLAAGISDDLLTATLLATRAPVLVCPAMHSEMWEHPAVQDNMATLRRRGVHVLEPESGQLAGGDSGPGRLASPERIVAEAERLLRTGGSGRTGDLAGMRFLVTAGGTREPIDPVRFIANRSSGRQGYAIAAEAAGRGAEVTLVTTVELEPPPGARVIRVETAAEMAEAVLEAARGCDAVVMAAAVADFRPKKALPAKQKKDEGPPDIVLEPTTDILAELGREKRRDQVLVGFAAETGPAAGEARRKLRKKGADVMVANDVSRAGAGFSGETNAVTIVTAGGEFEVPLASKRAVAEAVVNAALAELGKNRPDGTDHQED